MRETRTYRTSGGFTLMELLVVVAIIATVLAMAAPRLLPSILYSTHEGAARHLANYGRAAFAHAMLEQQAITIRVDLEHQEYWCEFLPEQEDEESTEEALEEDGLGAKEDDIIEQLAMEELGRGEDVERSEEGQAILDEQARRMGERFNERARNVVAERASRIKHDERYLPKDLDEFDRNETLLEEIEPEELRVPMLGRTQLPEGVYIAAVEVAGVQSDEGDISIELTPLGLAYTVKFWVAGEDGGVFVVEWDATTQRTYVREGDA